ncbi:MAG: YggT family protein [Actinomycetota bacterium]|nr:YggT family protein [Actinomycetota bacterium]
MLMSKTAFLFIVLQTFGYSISLLLTSAVNYAYYIMLGFIIAWVVISWFPGYPSTRFFQIIYDAVRGVVDPILAPLNRRIPPLKIGGFALSLAPIIAIFGLSIGRTLLLIIINQFIRPVTG